jgi:O-acetyl-ADP-ribose deacetylase (regulator of RNase III)
MLNELSKENMQIVENAMNDENSWMEYRTGNILEENDLDFIVHQANCFHCMGGGIAYALANKWPEVAEADFKQSIYGDPDKLGKFSIAEVTREIEIDGETINRHFKVINLYSQYHSGCAESEYEIKNSLKYIKNGLTDLRDDILECAFSSVIKGRKYYVGIPWMIGCGIYEMNINDVFEVIRSVFYGYEDVIKVIFVDFEK